MTISFTSSLAGLNQKQFDSLDVTAGPSSSYERLRQREADGRWRSRYLSWLDNDRIRAAIPIYECLGKSWPDTAYDPCSWNLSNGIGADCLPRRCLLIAGCTDRRSGFHVDADAKLPAQLRRLLALIAEQAADKGQCLIFPYIFKDARNALTEATFDRIVWTRLGREAHFREISNPQWESQLPSKMRYVLRRDRGLLAAADLTTDETTWETVRSWAIDLIAAHNTRKGAPDRPEFVGMRYLEWQRNPSVKLVVFKAESVNARGVLTALHWGKELELYEIGLDGEEGPQRLAVYLSLIFHLPVEYARSQGIVNVRAGFKAESPKASRGAVFEDLYGGILSISETRMLAHGN